MVLAFVCKHNCEPVKLFKVCASEAPVKSSFVAEIFGRAQPTRLAVCFLPLGLPVVGLKRASKREGQSFIVVLAKNPEIGV